MKINLFSDLFLLERIDHLIRTRATGSPERLASRLGCCQRDVFRLISSLRDQGFPIAYDRNSDSYYYQETVQLNISIVVGTEKLLAIQGGEKKLNIFSPLTDLGSDDTHLCNAS